MANINLLTTGLKNGHHPNNEPLTVIPHYDFTADAERWCERNVQSGFWINDRGWFSFQMAYDARVFRELWGS
jgi:hypothetical protein